MPLADIATIIGSYGFPIAMCVALFWYMVTEQKELRNVISNNTEMLTRILEHLKEGEEDGE